MENSNQASSATRATKVQAYVDRLSCECASVLRPEVLQAMSLSQYVARMERRGQKQTLRRKSNSVKDKPYLHLDSRRSDAANMARPCLRLHRASAAEEDPQNLDEHAAIYREQLPNRPHKSENCLFDKFADSVYFLFAYGQLM